MKRERVKSKILLIGGAGFLGTYILKHLLHKKYDVTCLVHNKPLDDASLFNSVKIVHGSVTDAKLMNQLVRTVDVIIHSARAQTHSYASNHAVTVQGIQNIIAASHNFKSPLLTTRTRRRDTRTQNLQKHIIFISSIAAAKKNIDAYARTKQIAEKLLQESNLRVTVLRPNFIFGKNAPGFSRMLRSILSFPVVFVLGDGKTLLQPIYAGDVALAVEAAIMHPAEHKKPFLLLDVAGKKPITYDAFVRKLMTAFCIQKPIVHIPLHLAALFTCALAHFARKLPFDAATVKSFVENATADTAELEKRLHMKVQPYEQQIRKLLAELR